MDAAQIIAMPPAMTTTPASIVSAGNTANLSSAETQDSSFGALFGQQLLGLSAGFGMPRAVAQTVQQQSSHEGEVSVPLSKQAAADAPDTEDVEASSVVAGQLVAAYAQLMLSQPQLVQQAQADSTAVEAANVLETTAVGGVEKAIATARTVATATPSTKQQNVEILAETNTQTVQAAKNAAVEHAVDRPRQLLKGDTAVSEYAAVDSKARNDHVVNQLVQPREHTGETAKVDSEIATTNQVAAQTNQVTAQTNQVTAQTNQVTAQINQVTAQINQVTAQTNQVTAQTNQVTAQTNQVTAQTNQVTAQTNQVTAQTNQVTAQTNQVTAQTNQITGRAHELVTRDENPVLLPREAKTAPATTQQQVQFAERPDIVQEATASFQQSGNNGSGQADGQTGGNLAKLVLEQGSSAKDEAEGVSIMPQASTMHHVAALQGVQHHTQEALATNQAEQAPAYGAQQVARQVAERLTSHDLKQGSDQISLKLTPEHLGSLQLNLRMEEQSLKLEIVAEHRSTRDALLQQADNLRETLAKQNISMDSFDVSTGNYGSQPQQSQNWQQAETNQRQVQSQYATTLRGATTAEITASQIHYFAPQYESTIDVRF